MLIYETVIKSLVEFMNFFSRAPPHGSMHIRSLIG